MRRTSLIATFLVLIVLAGCSSLKDTVMKKKGTLIFSLSQKDVHTLMKEEGLINVQSILEKPTTQKPSFIDIQIVGGSSPLGYEKIINIYEHGTKYRCEPLILEEGDYVIKHFIVLDEGKNPLYAMDIEKTITFTIKEDELMEINPVVRPTSQFDSVTEYGLMEIDFTVEETPNRLSVTVLKSFGSVEPCDFVYASIGIIPSGNMNATIPGVDRDKISRLFIPAGIESLPPELQILPRSPIGKHRVTENIYVIHTSEHYSLEEHYKEDSLFFNYKSLLLSTKLVNTIDIDITLKNDLKERMKMEGVDHMTLVLETYVQGPGHVVICHSFTMSELEKEEPILLYATGKPLTISELEKEEPIPLPIELYGTGKP